MNNKSTFWKLEKYLLLRDDLNARRDHAVFHELENIREFLT